MIFVAFENGNPVGISGIHIEDYNGQKAAHVWGKYVNKVYREKGIGTKLLNTSLQHVQQLPEIRLVKLMVNSNEIAAVKLYEKLGFQKIKSEDYVLGDGKTHEVDSFEKSII